jgi:hypothetical protein
LLDQTADPDDRSALVEEFQEMGMAATEVQTVLAALDALQSKVTEAVAASGNLVKTDSAARCLTRFVRFVGMKKKGGNSTVNRLFGLNDAANQVRARSFALQ